MTHKQLVWYKDIIFNTPDEQPVYTTALLEDRTPAPGRRKPNRILFAQVQKKEFLQLGRAPPGWLNDEIIHVFGSLLTEAVNDRWRRTLGRDRPIFVFARCMLWDDIRLLLEPEKKNSNTIQTKLYKEVFQQRGVSQDDILELDTIFLPVCRNNHWWLIAIRPALRLVEIWDSMAELDNGQWRTDSPRFIEATKYVSLWLENILPKNTYDNSEWRVSPIAGPQQTNAIDCGVYLCHTLHLLCHGYNPIVYEHEIERYREIISWALITRGFKEDGSIRDADPDLIPWAQESI